MIKLFILLIVCLTIPSFAQLQFDKNFDSGSLDSAYYSGGYWNINYATNLHFRVRGCSAQNPTFRIWVDPNWLWHFRSAHRMVWRYNSSSAFSYMDTAWAGGGYYYFRNMNAFTSDTIFIAYMFPYSYTETVLYMNSIQSNQWVRNAGARGNSILGRNIFGYEVTNPAFPDSTKKKIVITSRQHGYESLGQHVSMGLSDYLLNSTDSFAVWLRNNCIFYIYPMVNPDGVYLGLNTDTYSGYNPNRFWFNGDTVSAWSPCRETNIVRQDIWQRTGSRVYYSFDIHSNAGSLIYYYCGLKTAPEPFRSMAYEIVSKIRYSDSIINNSNILMPNDMACDTYQSSNWYADYWHWNNKQSVAFTLETATVPPQSLTRTRNNGIAIARGLYWVLKYPLTGINNITSGIPERFELFLNYPNPFNPNTVIRFSLPVAGMTNLKVYDILGREVATLVNDQLKSGTYEIEFDGKNYPSGIYFYSLEAGNFRQTLKMVLIK